MFTHYKLYIMSSVLQPFMDELNTELTALRQEIRTLSTELDTQGAAAHTWRQIGLETGQEYMGWWWESQVVSRPPCPMIVNPARTRLSHAKDFPAQTYANPNSQQLLV